MKEALNAVRSALGPEAMIERTRHVSPAKGGGLGTGFVEIIASAPTSSPWGFSGSGSGSERTAAARAPRTAAATRALPPSGSGLSHQDVERELANLRTMLEELSASRTPREQAATMLIAAGFAGPILRELGTGATKPARKGREALRAWLKERLKAKLSVLPGLANQGRQIVTCIGPTGAGKTTTLAKLAARARLDHGRSVAVITLDTFRVGAVEQWQRYAALLGIPLGVARNARELAELSAGSRADLLLVDTPGRHAGESQHVWRWPGMVDAASRERHVLLTIPAWLRAEDAENVLSLYEPAAPSGIVLTKLDETQRIGGAVQAALKGQLPVVYECDGPRVPEDVRGAAADSILGALLGGDS